MSTQTLTTGLDPDALSDVDAALRSFSVAKYRFHLIATTEITGLPAYKGSVFHGAFAHALKQISPHHYQLLHAPQTLADRGSVDIPKPFVLLPPLDTQQVYTIGEHFSCELTLFGQAIPHASLCHAALDWLGRRMGLGPARGRFEVERAEVARPGDSAVESPSGGLDGAVTGLGIAQSRVPLSGDSVTLHFPTRLRLKSNGAFLREPPPFSLLTARLLGRLNTLSHFHGEGDLLGRDRRAELLAKADGVQIRHSELQWHEWDRYSGRQREHMKFGGLLGRISYEGELEYFLPWLALGEWTHVGGKTSFGLGKYVLEEGGRK